MNGTIKKLLKKFKVYYGLQAAYRNFLDKRAQEKSRISYAAFRGEGYLCNSCGESYRKFVPQFPGRNISAAISKYKVIAGFGENVFCPNCMSTNRERLVIAVLQHMVSVAGKSILHLSPEKHVFNYISRQAVVTTADLEPGFYRRIDDNVVFADINQLPFADKSFDFIIANHILEHIPDDATAMKELRRVLKQDGTAILQVPFSTTLRMTVEEPAIANASKQEELFGQRDHVRIYAADDYVQRLQNAGFYLTILKEIELAGFEKHAIQKDEWVFLATR